MKRRALDPRVLAAWGRSTAAQARGDFWAFRQHISPDMHLAWWQKHVALELMQFWQAFNAGRKPKLILQAPPQHGKTKQVEDFIAWIAGKNPDLKFIFTSYSDELGVRVNLDLQRIIASPAYARAFANTQLATEHNRIFGQYLRNTSVLEFVGRHGSFRNTTVLGQINGQGLDIGVIDDPIKGRREAGSKTVRESTWNWLTHDFFGRFSERAGMLIMMTRWHVDDPVGKWLEHFPDTRVLRFAAVAEEADDWTVRAGYRKLGQALFPEHKSLAFLRERERVLTRAGWASLYQQQPIVVGGELFPVEHFVISDAAINRSAITRSVRYFDKAATEGGGAFTAGVLMHAMSNGTFLVEDVRHGQWGVLEREQRIKQTAQLDAKSCPRYEIWVEQEPGSGGKESAETTVRNLAGFSAHADRVTGSKEARAEPYAAQVQAGNVLVQAGAWNRAFLDEHEEFPAGKRKDIVDAAAGAFNKLAAPALRYDTTGSWI